MPKDQTCETVIFIVCIYRYVFICVCIFAISMDLLILLGLLYRQESGGEKRHNKKVCMLRIYRFLNCILTVTRLSI